MPRKDIYPDFLILGAAKCGTTSFHAWLDKHPDILMSDPKEPFFFEAEYEKGKDFYWKRYFRHWNGQALVGDARHRNLYLPYIPGRIKSINPRCRMLVLLRDPVARAHSHWWHWYRRGRDTLDFRAAMEADLARIDQGIGIRSDREIAEYARSLDASGMGPHRTYLDSGFYADQIERFFAHFPRDQIRVHFFEDMVEKPECILADTFAFLGVDTGYTANLDYQVYNANQGISWRFARKTALRHVWKATWKREKVSTLPARWARSLSRPGIDQDTRRWLEELYRPHDARLEALLGRKLPWR